ncbi:IQ calmodulin-binding motif family protein [Musa troglodytarum]|uniref:IQ calmodulin-binding motif family protein n=1 Tax=Musa troglodytarum TaxID=320322 RepID=A0A9E7KS32_9LILI|nr:IQ calmodulin-binding motif family protein [Musa troglodytarum]
MWKTGKWLRSFLTGKKDGKKEKAESSSSPLPIKSQSSPISVPAPKEKSRWSYPRWAGAGKSLSSPKLSTSAPPLQRLSEAAIDNKRHAMAVAVATAAAADAAVAAAQAAAAVVHLTTAATKQKASAVEEDAATKIQSAFRAYLARKALCALRGLVKLQALVRGHLVRKQAAATLRCMQALVIAQERARARRIRMAEESQVVPQWQSIHRKSPQHPQSRQSHDTDRNSDKNIEIVDMDLGGSRGSIKSRKSYSTTKTDTNEQQFSGYYDQNFPPSKVDQNQQFSPAPSALTEMSGRAYSGHFEDFSFITAQRSPQYLSAILVPDPTHSYGHPFFPNYMANTESSRAKARSQSAPRQRTDTFERQTSRRRPSTEGRNIPRVVKMQRSSSHVGLIVNGYQYPLSFKLDRSSMSLKDSECGSTSTVLTNTNYCS